MLKSLCLIHFYVLLSSTAEAKEKPNNEIINSITKDVINEAFNESFNMKPSLPKKKDNSKEDKDNSISHFDAILLKAEGRQNSPLVFQQFQPNTRPNPVPQSFRRQQDGTPPLFFNTDGSPPIQFPSAPPFQNPPPPLAPAPVPNAFQPPFQPSFPPPPQPFQAQQSFSQSNFDALNLSMGAVISERLTQNIANKFQLTRDQITTLLPNVDVTGTLVEQMCPVTRERSVPACAFERYRRFEGFCNNIQFLKFGNSLQPYRRLLPPRYGDGISRPRVSRDGRELPSPRLVSTTVLFNIDNPSRDVTLMIMQFGQFVDHDIVHTAGGTASQCCDNRNNPECLPIDVPPNDNFYSPLRISCLEFVRSLPAPREGCSLGPREQLNQLTSFIDGSNIYGNNKQRADSLRIFQGGRLRTTPLGPGFKDLLPQDTPQSQTCAGQTDKCFMSGDVRVNLQTDLTVVHTIWTREHNRVADILQRINPHWNDETVYQESRKCVIAEMQKIIYSEFLPIILGDFMNKFDINLLKTGFYDKYNILADATVASEFATAAYRFGHSLIQPFLEKYDSNNRPTNNRVLLSDNFFMPFDLYRPGECDAYIRGLINHPAQNVDNFVTDEVRNNLFRRPNERFGLDLPALNIQRGRDHGIPSYNEARMLCGLKRAVTFNDFADVIPEDIIETLARVYASPDDVDLWVAGISERHVPNGLVGPTFAFIIGKQFENFRRGDRFWFENIPSGTDVQSGLTEAQLKELRKVTYARIICNAADTITSIQPNVFKTPSPSNPMVSCASIPEMDMNAWRDVPAQG